MTLVDLWRDITVPRDLVYFRHGTRVLVANPGLAAWALLNDVEIAVAQALARPGRSMPSIAEAAIDRAIAKLVLNWLVYLPGQNPKVREPDQSLKMVYYAITDGCNLRCPYCYASSEKCLPGELTTAESISLIDQAAEMGAGLVVFTGGEPMLRKDLFAVADHTRSVGLRANIITNATLIRKQETAERLARTFDTITVSLDGGTADLHERTRGKGTFDRTVNALRMLNKFGVRPIINHVVTDRNVEHLESLADLFADIDVAQVRLMQHSELGRGTTDSESFGWGEYMKSHRFVWTSPKAANLLPDGPTAQKPCSLRGNCGMGGTEIYVNSLGDVYPCKLVTGPRHHAGNIRSSSLRDLFHTELMADLRTNSVFSGDNLTDCRRCYIRGACGGGCRAYHLARTGDVKRNSRGFCRVLRHQMVTSMWVAAGADRNVLVENDEAFVPRLMLDDSVHEVYDDWTRELPVEPSTPAPQNRRRLPLTVKSS